MFGDALILRHKHATGVHFLQVVVPDQREHSAAVTNTPIYSEESP
jgi:hypothetical protein